MYVQRQGWRGAVVVISQSVDVQSLEYVGAQGGWSFGRARVYSCLPTQEDI